MSELFHPFAVNRNNARVLIPFSLQQTYKAQTCARHSFAMPTLTIVGLSGHIMDFEVPCESMSVWQIKCEIKKQTGIPKREQKLMWGDIAMAPRTEIPNDGDVTLNLVRVRTFCGSCGRRRRRHLLLCSGCLNVAYCGSACQRSDWRNHKRFCCKCEN